MKQEHFLLASGLMLLILFAKAIFSAIDGLDLVLLFLIAALLFGFVYFTANQTKVDEALEKAKEFHASELADIQRQFEWIKADTADFKHLSEEMKKLLSLNNLATGLRKRG